MSWRTVVVEQRAKLDLSMGYMVVRGQETKRVFLDEMAVLIIENSAVSLTGCLVSELIRRKVKVIFCDEKRSPCAELVPTAGSHDCSRKIREQVAWPEEIKGLVWTEIIGTKIRRQAELLALLEKQQEAALLERYTEELEFNDVTNREGHAAKVYFNALFGMDFTRTAECPVNAALNYGYGLVLSAFNREISASGYLTQLGLHHNSMFNPFNLASDLMEPFRPFIDRAVVEMAPEVFETEEKHFLVTLLHGHVRIGGAQQTMLNAIRIYVKSVFSAIDEKDVSLLRFPQL